MEEILNREFRIADPVFSQKSRILVIAEIGTGHGGNLERAKELVDAAARAGADCAKFQIVYADEILHPDTGCVTLPGGPVRLYDRFLELEVPLSFFADIKSYCESKGLIFLCSPFGLTSARELASLGPSCIKIASPELNHYPLLRETASFGLPLILSSGVSRLADIERALELTESVRERVLLHCVTSYPAPEEDYNLRVLESLSSVFGVPVGVSDHSLDPVLVPVLAAACGACVIEKHICLSRSDPGLDDPVALDPEMFTKMTEALRWAEGKTGDEIISMLCAEYGGKRVRAVLGSGIKTLALSEKANYTRTNRSLHFMREMKKGSVIGETDIAILRTEKILTPGISCEFIEDIVGATLSRDVSSGAGVQFADVIKRG